MSRPLPPPLRENRAFAFAGERVESARVVPAAEARRLLAARNPTGRPNGDVLREFSGVAPDGGEVRRWAVDFPATMDEAERQLYVAPSAAVARAGISPVNLQRNDALRNALARLERFLACPAAELQAGFAWVEGEVVPDDSLLVWARDDDFSAGVLASRVFAVWLSIGPPLAALLSFPFPWPPAAPLSALSREQEKQRFALSRTARNADSAAIDDAVLRAYGWPADLTDDEIIARLRRLHQARSGKEA
ncbi:MAG: hypothetical protein C0502_03340 [Opitutus sp.]|nr:hypothetical protein [Opitutus sp.]